MPTLCLRVRQLRPKRKPMRRKLLPMPLSNSPPPVTVLLMEVIRLISKVVVVVAVLRVLAEAVRVMAVVRAVALAMARAVTEAMGDKIRINVFLRTKIWNTCTDTYTYTYTSQVRDAEDIRERESVERESCLSVPYYLHLLSILVDQITKCCEEGNRTVFLFATIEPPHKTDFIIYFSCEATLSYTHTTYHLYYTYYIYYYYSSKK
mmetsp:Transcript_16153/g.17417  ORF Transcript_16153/g.17417 Transcript_16153/m.17417 type:complete len:206 (+) Transcript_16153:1544-2161(+)